MLFSTYAADDTDRVRVKFCGLTQEDDVASVVQAGADAIGFICYPKSDRYVTPSRLMSLASLVPGSVTVVLVFDNPSAADVNEYLMFCPNATLQFHGNESREFCEQFGRDYIKSVKLDDLSELERAQSEYAGASALVALADRDYWSDDGHALDWQAVGALRTKLRKPLIVSGKLRQDTVLRAIEGWSPWAVDVAQGVENAGGQKCTRKVHAFMEAVESAPTARL